MVELITRTELEVAIATGAVTVVDALGGSYYEQQHLPGAVPLVAADVARRGRDVLPDTAAPIVTYCSDESCANSEQVARLLAASGYTNVRKYKEGIKDWVEAGLPVESGAPRSGRD